MNASRMSNANHWRGVGRNARAQGIPLDRILTKSERVNAWIREGYGS